MSNMPKPRKPKYGPRAGLTPDEARAMAAQLREERPDWSASRIESSLSSHGISGPGWHFVAEAYSIANQMDRLAAAVYDFLDEHGQGCRCAFCELFTESADGQLELLAGFKWVLDGAADSFRANLSPGCCYLERHAVDTSAPMS